MQKDSKKKVCHVMSNPDETLQEEKIEPADEILHEEKNEPADEILQEVKIDPADDDYTIFKISFFEFHKF
jgi:hypothetical protein